MEASSSPPPTFPIKSYCLQRVCVFNPTGIYPLVCCEDSAEVVSVLHSRWRGEGTRLAVHRPRRDPPWRPVGLPTPAPLRVSASHLAPLTIPCRPRILAWPTAPSLPGAQTLPRKPHPSSILLLPAAPMDAHRPSPVALRDPGVMSASHRPSGQVSRLLTLLSVRPLASPGPAEAPDRPQPDLSHLHAVCLACPAPTP